MVSLLELYLQLSNKLQEIFNSDSEMFVLPFNTSIKNMLSG